jgi:nitrogen fixation protein FixH
MHHTRSPWRFFPLGVAAALGLVVAVNVGMAWTALSTFPGNSGGDGFDLSNNYNSVLARAERQTELGWAARADIDAQGRPIVVMTGHSGDPLTGAAITGIARRVLGDEHAIEIQFRETNPGYYLGDRVVDEKGQWRLDLSATEGGRDFAVTRRIVAR